MKKKRVVSKIKKKKKSFSILSFPRTFGEKTADSITKWAGSWFFIISFTVFLLLWILLNTSWLVFGMTWDEKPFILLNLILSCLAALQAPIILMSQNRQSQKDRQRAEYDYAVNRKAEREVQQIKKLVSRIDRKIK